MEIIPMQVIHSVTKKRINNIYILLLYKHYKYRFFIIILSSYLDEITY